MSTATTVRDMVQYGMADKPVTRSDAEMAAQAALYDAEAVKALAEARQAGAEADRTAAEATAATAAAEMVVIELDKCRRSRDKDAADDQRHHVYRFTGQVESSSVHSAVTKLTEWHRQDPDCDMEIIFFSPGGSVIPGFALFDHLRWLSSEGHHITTGCTGMAASMGGILIQAGDTRWMSGEAWYMIHRAAFGAAGKTYEVEDEVEWVKRIEARIISLFVARSSLTAQKIKRNWDRKDWWIDSDQALEYGLVDEIRGGNQPDEDDHTA